MNSTDVKNRISEWKSEPTPPEQQIIYRPEFTPATQAQPQAIHNQQAASSNPIEALAETFVDKKVEAAARVANEMQINILKNRPKTKSERLAEESEKAVLEARNAVKDFKAQYIKPERCLYMHDKDTRMFCANHFMKAKKEWEEKHKDEG